MKDTQNMYEEKKATKVEVTLGILLEQVRTLMQDMSEIKIDVRDLRDFKWKLIGVTTLGAFVVTIATTITMELLKQ